MARPYSPESYILGSDIDDPGIIKLRRESEAAYFAIKEATRLQRFSGTVIGPVGMCIHSFEDMSFEAETAISEIGNTLLSRVIVTKASVASILAQIADEIISSACRIHNKPTCKECEPWYSLHILQNSVSRRHTYLGTDMERTLQNVYVSSDIVYNYLVDNASAVDQQ